MNQQQPPPPPLPKVNSAPKYRSVSMAPSMPPPLRSPFFQQESTKHQRVSGVNPTIISSSIPPKKANNNNSKPWTLVHPLPSVPAGYMLERNQIHIPTTTTNTSPQEIANRISECLNLRSFVISETSSEIKNAFRAESCKGRVLFRINFFSLQDSDEQLIIEFQRLAGCSYEFQRTFQAIHRCVCQQEGEETKQELEFPVCVLPTTTSTSDRKERLLDTFSIAMDMIQSSRLDSQLMGLEVLEPMSTSPEIVPLLLSSECYLTTLLDFCRGTEEPLSQLQQQQECLLKRRALSVLANALGEDSRPQNNNNEDDQVILNTLLSCLNNNRYHDPHQSFQVARCLVSLSKTNASFLKDSQAVSLLAGRTTTARHFALEQEHQKLESILLLSS